MLNHNTRIFAYDIQKVVKYTTGTDDECVSEFIIFYSKLVIPHGGT
jgi:hypothetical protein